MTSEKGNEVATQELIEFIRNYPSREFSFQLIDDKENFRKEIVNFISPAIGWVKNRIKHETVNGLGTLDNQKDWFIRFNYVTYRLKLKNPAIRKLLFSSWALETKNMFGIAFALGRQEQSPQEQSFKKNRKRTVQATNGRRLIGAASRERVRLAAKSKVGLSKEKASIEIADEISLSSGTVRRYLSELYPGKTWPKN